MLISGGLGTLLLPHQNSLSDGVRWTLARAGARLAAGGIVVQS
jgi:hypothetical protein